MRDAGILGFVPFSVTPKAVTAVKAQTVNPERRCSELPSVCLG